MDLEITNLNIYIYVYLDESHIDLILHWPPSVIVAVVGSLLRGNANFFVSLELLKEVASSALTKKI